jgi:hypothetical protein
MKIFEEASTTDIVNILDVYPVVHSVCRSELPDDIFSILKNWSIFLRALEWKILVYFVDIYNLSYNLWSIGIFNGHLVCT